MKVDQDSAKVTIPPPLILLLTVVLGLGLHLLFPLPFISNQIQIPLGATLILLGIGIILYSGWLFRKFQTDIKPWKTTSRIIQSGIYGYSRNPIYLAFLILGLGFAVSINSVWILILQIPYAFVLNNWVIKKEETYLESKFGEEYVSYKKNVRRWI